MNYLAIVGGATIKHLVSRTMNRVLSPDLAEQFVWTGRLTRKHGFNSLELKNVLCG